MRNISILLLCLALVFGGFIVGANAKNLPVSFYFFENESTNYKIIDEQVYVPLTELTRHFNFLSIGNKIVNPAEIYSDTTLKKLIKTYGPEKYQPFKSIHVDQKTAHAQNNDINIEVRVIPFDYRYNSINCYWVKAVPHNLLPGQTIDLLPERTTYNNPKPSCWTAHRSVNISNVYLQDRLNLEPSSETALYPHRLPWEGFIVPQTTPEAEDTSLIFTYEINSRLKTISVKL